MKNSGSARQNTGVKILPLSALSLTSPALKHKRPRHSLAGNIPVALVLNDHWRETAWRHRFLRGPENTEGEYSSPGGRVNEGTENEVVIQESVFTRRGVERILR